MASTRASTGNSRPRVHATISTAPERKRRTTTTGSSKKSTAGASKKTGTAGGVRKRAPATHHKRKPHLSDKIEGAAEKAVGKVTGRPGKKAAGTKKMRGTDGKNNRSRRV
ncbi:hypothetical protein F4778DRAFT_107956 [Xylariomycetidae sp. FL2044]|nr:hypothetical protein F4778DRAFT_107956 [Xylariomycetidae sp. FL2044]